MHFMKLPHEILTNARVMRLESDVFAFFIKIALVASTTSPRDGTLPSLDDIAYRLHMSDDAVTSHIETLINRELVELHDDQYKLSEFAAWQKPISGAERTRLYRERKALEKEQALESRDANVTQRDESVTLTSISISNSNSNSNKRDQDHWVDYRDKWIALFPDRAAPRKKSRALQSKLVTRRKKRYFRDNWEKGLELAKQSKFLMSSAWFSYDWILKNDDNLEKIIEGRYQDKVKQNGHSPAAGKRLSDVQNKSGRL